MEFAKLMAVSEIGVRKHLRGNPGACLAVTVQALEWRMSPYAVANKSYLVNDQIAWESQLVQAVILQRAPIKGRIRYSFEGEGGKRRCIASAELADGSGVVDYESPPFDQSSRRIRRYGRPILISKCATTPGARSAAGISPTYCSAFMPKMNLNE